MINYFFLPLLEYFFFSIVFVISILGIGFYFSNKIFVSKVNYISELGINGLLFISFIITFAHFFLAISDELIFLIIFFGIILFFLNLKKIYFINEKENYKIILLFFITIFIFFNFEPNEDFGLYHLPYVINFKSEKIIFGLSNLQLNQGWNSLWLNLHSFFSLSFNNYKTIYILNIIFFIFINSIFLENIFFYKSSNFNDEKNLKILIKYFCIFFFCYFNIKYARLNTFGIDVPSNYLIVLSVLYFFKTLKVDNDQFKNLKILFILVFFAFMCRISNSLFILLPLFLAFKYNLFFKFINSRVCIFLFLFSIIWTLQQFIYTGCLIFPYEFFCSLKPIWFDTNFIDNFKMHTFYVNKSFSSYSGPLNIEEYHRSLNWVPNWFQRNKIEIIEHISAFVFPILFIIYQSKKIIKEFNYSFILNNNLHFLILISLLSFLLWFFNSPVIRMGSHYFFLIFFFIIFFLLNYFGQLRFRFNNKVLYLLITIVFLFSFNKNIKRITNKNFEKTFFPKYETVNFETNKVEGININRVLEGQTIQSRVCWNTPFLCSISDDFTLKVNNSYIFLLKKH